MSACSRRKCVMLLSVTMVLATCGTCLGAVYQDLDFTISLSSSWEAGHGVLWVNARWLAPKRGVNSYLLYVDGRFTKYASGKSTSVIGSALHGSYSSYTRFMADVEAYLARPHTFVLEARMMMGESLYDVYEYLPPQVLVVESRMAGGSGIGSDIFQLVHQQEGTEGHDPYDGLYAPGQLPKQAKIVSTVWDSTASALTELEFDARPLESTSSVSLELSLISTSADSVVISSPQSHELVLGFPGAKYGNEFGAKPLTIQQYDPDDSSVVFPVYDVRRVIEDREGVIALPDLHGTYDSGVPYAFFRLSFTREVSADLRNDERLDFRDFAVLAGNWGRDDGRCLSDISGCDGLGLPDGRVDGFDLMVLCRQWAGVVRDGFESGDFDGLTWLQSGFPFWKVVSTQSRSGSYCAQAGPIEDSGRTSLIVSIPCGAGQVSFWRKVSSESAYDVLRFSIDRQVKAEWSGELDWERVVFPVEAGTRMFTWEYCKDDSSAAGQDTAWIDDVMLPAP